MNIPTENALLITARAAVLSFDSTALMVKSKIRENNKPTPRPVHNKPSKTNTLLCVNVMRRNPAAVISKPVGIVHFFNFIYTLEKANPVIEDPNVETDKPKVIT